MNRKAKRVVVAFRLAGEPGRRKLSGFLRYLAENQLAWELQFVRIREDFSKELVAAFPERHIDGIVYSMPSAGEGAAELAKLQIPTVALDIYDESILNGRKTNLVYVQGDAEKVGRAAAQNLLSQGLFRSYGFVADLQGSVWGKLRGQAFLTELKANGFPVHRYTTRGKRYDLPHLVKWLAQLPKPVGIFSAFDDRAIQVIEACHEAGLAIPDDVAVIGVDNDEMLCANTTPPLSSVQPDHEAMGALAAARLAAMMAGANLTTPERHEIGVKEVIIRESTSPVSTAGRLVQRALAFIRTHATEAIKPRDVAQYLKVSRSLADLRFREHLNESMGEAILHHRLEAVRRRLITSNNTIGNIAADCHFPKLCRLNEAFRKAYGTTMRDYRKAARATNHERGSAMTDDGQCKSSNCPTVSNRPVVRLQERSTSTPDRSRVANA